MIRQHGLTLIELLVTITVAAILLAIGVPSFTQAVNKTRLVGAADNLLADMRYAQAESMKTNTQVIAVISNSNTSTWSYSLSGTSPTRTQSVADYQGSVLSGTNVTFEPKRNTISTGPGTVITVTIGGKTLGIEVQGNTSMRLCTDTTARVSGYPICP